MSSKLTSQLLLLARLIRYSLKARPDAAFTTMLGVCSSFIEVASLAMMIPLTRLASGQQIAPNSPWHGLSDSVGFQPSAKFFASAFFALLLLRALTQLTSTILTNHLNRRLHCVFSTRALEAFVRHLSFANVQKDSIGHFVAIAGDEAVRAAQIVSSIVKLVPMLFLFALYAGMIAYQSWQVGLGLLLFIGLVLASLWGAFKKSHQLGQRQQVLSRQAGTHFIETLSGLRTVRSFTAENYVISRYSDMMAMYVRTLFQVDSINSFGSLLPTLMMTAGMLIAICFMSTSQLAALLPAIVVGVMMVFRLLPLASLTMDTALRLTADLKAAETVSEMLEAVETATKEDRHSAAALQEPIRRIDFEHVDFRYDTATANILDNFSSSFFAGKSYAISGESGAGKSTIADLMLNFYVPQSGTIRVNGRNISQLSQNELRQRIALVEQTTRIFFDTIESNIQFGNAAPPSDIASLVDAVGLHEFVASLPQKSRTMLNFQGSNVSGGQRQRIGLARGLLRNADVLIMDESTSALDPSTRERILTNVFERYRDRILIFITHDPEILIKVDHVIRLGVASAPTRAAGE